MCCFFTKGKSFLFFSFLCIIIILYRIADIIYSVEELPNIEDVRYLEQEAAAADTDEDKFRFLGDAIQVCADLYASGEIGAEKCQIILSRLHEMHQLHPSLQLRQRNVIPLCFKKSVESIKLLQFCISNHLISFSYDDDDDDDALLAAILRNIAQEEKRAYQQIETQYSEIATNIIIQAVEQGARFSAFNPSHEPMSEEELINLAIHSDNLALFSTLVDSEIISKHALLEVKNRQLVEAANNQNIVKYYHMKFPPKSER